MTRDTEGNVTAGGMPVRDEDLIPVPCKCCGQMHPACGCWNTANASQLAGHDCLESMRQGEKGMSLSVVWNSKHPSQQRSAIYFHLHRLRDDVPDLLICEAAIRDLEKSFQTPEGARALERARAKLEAWRAQVIVSMAFLDEQDPTRKVH